MVIPSYLIDPIHVHVHVHVIVTLYTIVHGSSAVAIVPSAPVFKVRV